MKHFFFKSKIYKATVVLFIINMVGTAGFMMLESYSFIDAMFMTIITVSTVGFGIIKPLDTAGKIFTIALIFSSIGAYMYAASIITKYIVDGQFLVQYKYNRVYNKILKLSDHVIVCGYGRNGKQAVQKLIAYDRKFVIIENKTERIEEINKNEEFLFVEGDATDDDVLIKAGIEKASALISSLAKDSENVFVVLSARQLNKDLSIISRASNENSTKKLKIAGANNVIMPDRIGGDHMASLVVTPDVIEFMDNLSLDGSNESNIEEVIIDDISNGEDVPTIKSVDLRKHTGVTVIGLKTPDGEYHVNPDINIKLVPKSKLIVLGTSAEISKLHDLCMLK